MNQKIAGAVNKIVIKLRFLIGDHPVKRIPHGHRTIEDLIKDDAPGDGSVAALLSIPLEQCLLRLRGQVEFENSLGQVISGIGKIEFGSTKIMMFEIDLVDS